MPCPRCKAAMDEVVRIEPLQNEPGWSDTSARRAGTWQACFGTEWPKATEGGAFIKMLAAGRAIPRAKPEITLHIDNRSVVPHLCAIGHVASAPTMTGVGERKHLISDTVGLTTNIDDIVNHIEMEGLHDIHLVGWSYGGMVATGVLALLSGRIRSVIYLDAFVPENGKALADYVAPPVRERFLKAAAEKQHITPIPFDVFGVKDARVVEYCVPRLVRQPWLSLTEPVKALPQQPDIPHTYIRCTGYDPSSFATFYERFKSDPRWDTQLLASSHVCMLEHPKETVKLLANAR